MTLDDCLAFEDLIDELDSITGDNTEAVILISVNGPTICVRTFGHPAVCADAVERAHISDPETYAYDPRPLLH